jgi:hypothetical protein
MSEVEHLRSILRRWPLAIAVEVAFADGFTADELFDAAEAEGLVDDLLRYAEHRVNAH